MNDTKTSPKPQDKLYAPAAGSNYLPDLALRIRAEHEATSAALKTSVEHAMAAGELLIEAKALLKHGQWLPWLAEHCSISDRTAQLYMRCAKYRTAIEANTQCVADLTLNEAAAVLMLSSDIQKLFAFAKRTADADPDELIKLCAAEGIATITKNPFGAKDFVELEEPEQLEWVVWCLFWVKELGSSGENAFYRVDRLQSRGWTLTNWYGDEGDRWRKRNFGTEKMPQDLKDEWHAFLERNRDRTIDDVQSEIIRIDEERPAVVAAKRKPRRGRR